MTPPDNSSPLEDLAKLFAPTRFLINPAWKDGGYTHAHVPEKLPVSLGKFEVVEDLYCPHDMGVLLYPSGEIAYVRFTKQPEEP